MFAVCVSPQGPNSDDWTETLVPQGADPLPLPLGVAKIGRNHLNEEFTSLLRTGIDERF
jgi:hypothetical protein